MDSTKYIGMDVDRETISIAVINAAGRESSGPPVVGRIFLLSSPFIGLGDQAGLIVKLMPAAVRFALIGLSLAFLAIGMYHRIRAAQSGDRLDRTKEGLAQSHRPEAGRLGNVRINRGVAI